MTLTSRRTPRWVLALVACALATAVPLGAQEKSRGWTAYWENDSFVLADGTDRNYTNGVRLVWAAGDAPANTFRGRSEDWWRKLTPLLREGFVFTSSAWAAGQNFFTPSVITVYDVDPLDRPYAGLAYFGLRIDATDNSRDLVTNTFVRRDAFTSTFQHSLEVDAGVLGPAAGARVFQTFAHVLRENRIPKGWHHQLPHEPFLSANTMWRGRFGTHFADLTPHGGVMLGTVQTYPYGGATLRLGWNMTDFPALLIAPTAVPVRQRPEWEIAFVTGVEGRAMLRNAFVEGGLRPDSEGIDATTWVGDWRWGFSVRLTEWRLTWTQVRRSSEVTGESPVAGVYHDYGSLTFGYEPGRTTSGDREGTFLGAVVDGFLGRVLDGFLLEAGTGPADADPVERAQGSRVGVAKRVWGDRIALGGEVVGIGRELGPPPIPGGDHRDLFLVNKLITVRAIPFGRLGPGRLHVRAGGGSGLSKLQVTPGEPGERPGPCPAGLELDDRRRRCNRSETAAGWMLGAGYWFAMPTDRASLGIDYSWNTIRLDEAIHFATVTLGFQWHP